MKRTLSFAAKSLLVLACVSLAANFTYAQITESALRGKVTDTQGDAIAASAVVAQSDATGQVRTATTDESGSFVFASLPPGSYTVYVRVPGFKTYALKGLRLNVGVRWDYFGDAKERENRLSSIILGAGNSFGEQIANATVGRVERLYTPEKTNFSPRLGLAFDPFGDGKTSLRAGFSLAFQPHHGQSIAGARALPPDAVQVVSQPSQGIGTQIL